MKYIVLLRGINISGKNKIAMSELKKILESNNYLNVITYLNSGNVILNSDNSKEYIVDDIRTFIKKKFNLEIPVYVIEHLELKDILEHNPIWWGTNNKGRIIKRYMIILSLLCHPLVVKMFLIV